MERSVSFSFLCLSLEMEKPRTEVDVCVLRRISFLNLPNMHAETSNNNTPEPTQPIPSPSHPSNRAPRYSNEPDMFPSMPTAIYPYLHPPHKPQSTLGRNLDAKTLPEITPITPSDQVHPSGLHHYHCAARNIFVHSSYPEVCSSNSLSF